MDGYQLLARSVLDAVNEDVRSHAGRTRREARRFVEEGGLLYEMWCAVAGYDPAAFREAVLRERK